MHGLITAMITPFDRQGDLDLVALRLHLDRLLAAGARHLMLLGTTGEVSTLCLDEQLEIVQQVLQNLPEEASLGVNICENSTARALDQVRRFEQHPRIDYLMAVTPYYNRPSQQELVAYFQALAAASSRPLLLYSNPKRTGVTLELPALQELAATEGIFGLKEGAGSLPFALAARRALPSDFKIYCGDDRALFAQMAAGATDGVISSASNLFPALFIELTETLLEGRLRPAQRLHLKLLDLLDTLAMGSNPVPLKAMLNLLGHRVGSCRPPLSSPTQKELITMQAVLEQITDTESSQPCHARQ